MGIVGGAAPEWVKLVRTGDVITGYASPDGANWTEVASLSVPMSTQIYVGLAVTSHNSGVLNQSTFDYVRVSQATTNGIVSVDSGGGAVGTYQADADVSGGNTASFGAPIDLSGVTDPAPQAVYQTERYGQFTYAIPGLNPGGLYTVRLHFAEDYWNSAGQRIFDVSINGTQVLTDFDIFAVTGAQNKAIVEQFAARADASGRITIAYTPSASSPDQNAKSSGIEVIPVANNGRLLAQPADVQAVAGVAFTGTLATFVDTSPGGLVRDYIATTTWDDGTVSTSQVQPDPSGSGYDVVDSHTYSSVGTHTVRISIQSYDGAGVQLTTTEVVKPQLQSVGVPTIVQATAGTPTGTIVVATFTDANPAANLSNLSATINWRDGAFSRHRNHRLHQVANTWSKAAIPMRKSALQLDRDDS